MDGARTPMRSWSRGVAVGALAALALVGCGSSGGGDTPAATLTRITIGTQPITVARGASVLLTATGTYSDGTTANLTSTALWASSDLQVAIFSARGQLTGVAPGTVTVTAGVGTVSGQAQATVTLPPVTSLAVTPATGSVPAGEPWQLKALASRADGMADDVTSVATWSTSNGAVATVSSTGMATIQAGAAVGATATLTAAYAGVQGQAVVTVVQLAPIGPQLASDPMALQQWHLRNTGQNAYADLAGVAGMDLHLSSTYARGWTGQGVKVAVVDSGLEIAHEDLAANVVPGSWNFVDGTSDPTPPPPPGDVEGDHGTSVSGIIGAVYGNAKGGMGVAPGVGLNGYNALQYSTYANLVKSLGFSSANPKSNDVAIFNQSWGSDGLSPDLANPVMEAAYASGVENLRGGLGALYVKSAGNGFRGFGPSATTRADCTAAKALGVSCQNASMDGLNTLPYMLVVGALNASGERSSYSTAGSALWASAPGGEYGLNESVVGPGLVSYAYAPAMVTTDRTGCDAGYAMTNAGTSVFDEGGAPNLDCSYTNTFNGTSSAAPSLSGCIALLLQARPWLTWREVKHVLAHTAWRPQPTIAPVYETNIANGPYEAELPWTTNAAGYAFHDWFGFGAVNVDDAIAYAGTLAPGFLGNFTDTGWTSSAILALAIPDGNAVGATNALALPAAKDLSIESVQVKVSIIHPSPSDLGIEITSPSGTRSILLNIKNGFAAGSGIDMTLGTNAFYGERSAGTWTVKVVDGVGNALVGSLSSWGIRVYGH